MPYRKILFVKNQFYHVFNRGVAALPIFSSTKDYQRFLNLVQYYRFANVSISFSHFNKLPVNERLKYKDNLKDKNKLNVEIVAFCFMPNHFHFLLKQITENGIAKFMKNLQNSYAKFYNIRTVRNGPLFQSMFKGVRIDMEEQLLHVSRYIHLNPSTGYLVKIQDLANYMWSSLPEYLSENHSGDTFISSEIILSLVGGKNKYLQFMLDQAEYQRELSKIKHLTLE